MVKDYSDSETENPLPPHGLLFPISSKGSFVCTMTQTDTTYGKINRSMGPPRRIDPMIRRTMSERSYHGATSRSQGEMKENGGIAEGNNILFNDE